MTFAADWTAFDQAKGQEPGEQSDQFANFPAILSGKMLITTYPERRPIVVDGLIREGDVCNIVAAPKVGKSWLALNLAMSVASGETWLGQFETVRGRTLYVDNELHPTDAAFRLVEVSRALETAPEVLTNQYHVVSFRGFPVELSIVCRWIRHMVKERERGYYKLIVIDTLSKMLAGDKSENDNLYFRSIYTQLESLASDIGSAIVIVHHTSRGDQSEKSVTDTGAGAGSQSRACDCHIAVRPHAEDGFCVLDAAVRSFPGSPSLSIRWEYPLWTVDGGKTPELGNTQTRKRRQQLDRAMREALDIINAHPETAYTVSKLDDLIEGVGYSTIRTACEKLSDDLKITRRTGSYKGKDTVVYEARV